MVGLQLKMFKLFDSEGIKSLSNIFGEKNIVGFSDSNIVGIKYDFDKNKLQYVMQKIPFTLTQQLIITSQLFIEIIENISSRGYRPYLQFNMELPEEELSQLKGYVFRISKPNVNKELNKQLIFDEINRIEDEYGAEIESVSFNFDNHRVVFRNNGILFADEDVFDVAGEMLCH